VPSILDKVFKEPRGTKSTSRAAVDDLKAVGPKEGEKLSVLALLRDTHSATKRTAKVAALSDVGAKLLSLPKGKMWQATLVANDRRPNLGYTCLIPERLGLPKSAKDKMVFATMEGHVAGDHAIWLVTDIRVV